jgi:elongation factor Tu
VVKPGSITPHTEFEANVYILSKDEGGRHTPVLRQLPAAVLLPDDGRHRRRDLPEGTEMVMPGRQHRDDGSTLIQPIAMEEGLQFAIREGGRTVGAGRVTKILK